HDVTEIGNFCPHCGASLAKLSGDATRMIPQVSEEIQFDDLSAEDVAALESLPPGSGMLVVPHGAQAGARYLLDADVVTAGRHPRCDIFLDDITVSRQHARFTRSEGQLWVRDENSLNGTYVNGSLIDGPVTLHRGDDVQIGKFRMIFFSTPSGQTPTGQG
ncbi:MAG: FHA domain-containing protein, partial [Propionicimonas sp.]|nr:FHA domain-containing protein [Propionicimonas sp.]